MRNLIILLLIFIVPTKGYERWKNLQLNFDAREMLEG